MSFFGIFFILLFIQRFVERGHTENRASSNRRGRLLRENEIGEAEIALKWVGRFNSSTPSWAMDPKGCLHRPTGFVGRSLSAQIPSCPVIHGVAP
jgi:hypothetical protein